MRNDNAQLVVNSKQIAVSGYSPKETALSEGHIPKLVAQIQDERTVIGVQQIGKLANGTEFLLLKIFIPKEVQDELELKFA